MKTCIVMYTDQSYAFAAANMCIGIQRYCSNWVDDIIIYNEGLEEATKKILPRCTKVLFSKSTRGGDFIVKSIC